MSGISRRRFLQSAGIGTLGALGAGALAACSPVTDTGDTGGTNTPAASGTAAAWRTAPTPVTDSEIVREYSADVVVVGAGHAGIAATREATEQGKSAILLDMLPEGAHTAMGNAAGCLNSNYLLDKGIDSIDPIEFYNNWQLNTNNGAQPTLIMKYAQNSGEACDWFIVEMASADEMESTTTQYWPRNSQTRSKMMDGIGPHKFWSSSIDLYGMDVLSMTDIHNRNIEKIQQLGGQHFPGTHGEYLVQDNDGAVTGVIAKTDEGYVKFNASAVVIATGGFGGNEDMCQDLLKDLYYAFVEGDKASTMNMDGDGSGIAMAYWIGARIEEGRTIATMDGRTPWIGASPGLSLAIGHPQGIWLDEKGRRFENEFWGPIEFRHRSALNRNRELFYAVYDSKLTDYMEYVVPSHGTKDPTSEYLQVVKAAMDAAVVAGAAGYQVESEGGPMGSSKDWFWYGANTLEEVVGYLDADAKVKQNILDSVKKYNSYVDAKADQEFGRDPAVLFPIKDGPFFVQVIDHDSSIGNLMVTMGGLIVNGDQQVLGANWKPIKGLFASGNATGGRFGDDYFSPIFGVSLGICMTLGRECGRSVVQYLNGEL
jgi:succinate dehydrogenase/fumarate reductase flavoprotein subunit